ncbi:claudin-4-like [Pundamilia nyererei]|uniref:Claudin-4-like n=1 Tax=Pundamilia nyererei TaxID=303518 RepID=A0A9Y3VDK9_9CICH|nr:PREDICTED: claudin-4-like [Pundamilia nyererei]
MADCKLLGLVLAIICFLGSIITCVLPMWRVTAFIGTNIVTAQAIHEGLWMSCVVQSTSQKQCKVYDSELALSQDLQAARALIIIAILLGFFGILFAVVGYRCSNLIKDFYNPLWSASQKRELGSSLYIGWGSAGLLFLGGGLLCSSRPRMNDTDFLEATEFEGRPQKMREIRATVADLAWQGRTYLGRLVGEQTLLLVEKDFLQVIGVVAESVANHLNAVLQYILQFLKANEIQVDWLVARTAAETHAKAAESHGDLLASRLVGKIVGLEEQV